MDSKDAMEVKHVHGDIQYNNITFGYENKEPILNDISLKYMQVKQLRSLGIWSWENDVM